MDKRLELHEILCGIVNITEPDGDRHTYFDPPSSVKIKYPAIVYSRKAIVNKHADNVVYKQGTAYELIVIDDDPDSEIVGKVSKLPMCWHDRHYKVDNLNHDAFTIYH